MPRGEARDASSARCAPSAAPPPPRSPHTPLPTPLCPPHPRCSVRKVLSDAEEQARARRAAQQPNGIGSRMVRRMSRLRHIMTPGMLSTHTPNSPPSSAPSLAGMSPATSAGTALSPSASSGTALSPAATGRTVLSPATSEVNGSAAAAAVAAAAASGSPRAALATLHEDASVHGPHGAAANSTLPNGLPPVAHEINGLPAVATAAPAGSDVAVPIPHAQPGDAESPTAAEAAAAAASLRGQRTRYVDADWVEDDFDQARDGGGGRGSTRRACCTRWLAGRGCASAPWLRHHPHATPG